MDGKFVYAACAIALVSACNQQPDVDRANTVVPSAETRTPAAPAALTGDQALAAAKDREHHMEALGEATKKVSNQLKSSTPELAAIRRSASEIAGLAPKLQSWFPEGTAEGVGKSRAKPEIWKKAEDFTLKAHDFGQAASEFDVAARNGDMARIKTAFAAVGKACKACHDVYRAPKKD